MFDKYVISGRRETTLVPYEKTVIEKRAPTDDSIKLYEEIKEKAFKSIIDQIEIKNNLLNAVAIVCHDSGCFGQTLRYKITLNGKDIYSEFPIDQLCGNRNEIYKKLFEESSKHIAIELLKYADSERLIK